MSSTRLDILDAIKTAMKAGDKTRLGTLRLAAAAIKQKEVDDRIEVDEPTTMVILDRMVKERRDSIEQYSKAGREDLAAVERAEIEVLQDFLPAALSEQEIAAIIEAAMTESGASSMRDMGAVMNLARPQLQGRADIGAVSQQVKSRLQGG